MTTDTEAILAGVRQWAHENEVEVDALEDSQVAVVLPGEKKLKTTVSITISARTVQLQAFVIRHPDENAEEFNRWLLMKNMKPGPVAFGIDSLGDVYLGASVPRDRLLDELDFLLGAILATADSSFNELLLIGFLTGMKKEWAWRINRGESTRNLAAFADVLSGMDNEFLAGPDAGPAGTDTAGPDAGPAGTDTAGPDADPAGADAAGTDADPAGADTAESGADPAGADTAGPDADPADSDR